MKIRIHKEISVFKGGDLKYCNYSERRYQRKREAIKRNLLMNKQTSKMPISKEEIYSLFDWLDCRLATLQYFDGNRSTFEETIQFLEENGLKKSKVLPWLKEHGGYCDYQILFNVRKKWGDYVDRKRRKFRIEAPKSSKSNGNIDCLEFMIAKNSEPLKTRWAFAGSDDLMDFNPDSVVPETLVGNTICSWSACCGSYGMGGLGYLGFKIDSQWLIIAIHGADSFFHLDGKMFSKYKDQTISSKICESPIKKNIIKKHSMRMEFGNNSVLSIEESADLREVYSGSFEPVAFTEEDDLRRGIFLSPTPVIYKFE